MDNFDDDYQEEIPAAAPGYEWIHGGGEGVRYRECLKNHAVGMGGHSVDGCGEFLAAGEEGTLKCAACNCHRNFHRKDNPSTSGSSSKKRHRTKFTAEQKEKMLGFAERIGWRIQKTEEEAVEQFCADTGLTRQVLKVWMHNNKHTLGNKP